MAKNNNRTHSRNPLYFLLQLSLRARTKGQACPPGLKKSGTFLLGRILDLSGYLYAKLSGIRSRYKWFNRNSAREAERKRAVLLEQLSGRIKTAAGGSKLYTGTLSPGCIHCIEGDWACNFINRLCNRDCFFCKRSHSLVREELEPETWGFFFQDTKEHLDYLKTFHIKGISFSGGEPLLVRDRLLRHLTAVRDEFGDAVYIWMYTNGDLVTDEILADLNMAGLDEIRFNIAAREYELTPVILARQHIKTVTVEIPCIPEDHETLKALLPEMERAGIDFLNIHQLSVEEQNCRELVQHSYSFTGYYPGITVYESEICALQLLLHALENGINLPVNYCTSIYKSRFQGRGFRKQRASAFRKGSEELTATGHLRKISISATGPQLRELEARLTSRGIDPDLWGIESDRSGIVLHSSLIPKIEWPDSGINITYFTPGTKPATGSSRLEAAKLAPDNKIVFQAREMDRPLFELWTKLYLNRADRASAQREFRAEQEKISPATKNPEKILRMAEYEIQQENLPGIL